MENETLYSLVIHGQGSQGYKEYVPTTKQYDLKCIFTKEIVDKITDSQIWKNLRSIIENSDALYPEEFTNLFSRIIEPISLNERKIYENNIVSITNLSFRNVLDRQKDDFLEVRLEPKEVLVNSMTEDIRLYDDSCLPEVVFINYTSLKVDILSDYLRDLYLLVLNPVMKNKTVSDLLKTLRNYETDYLSKINKENRNNTNLFFEFNKPIIQFANNVSLADFSLTGYVSVHEKGKFNDELNKYAILKYHVFGESDVASKLVNTYLHKIHIVIRREL